MTNVKIIKTTIISIVSCLVLLLMVFVSHSASASTYCSDDVCVNINPGPYQALTNGDFQWALDRLVDCQTGNAKCGSDGLPTFNNLEWNSGMVISYTPFRDRRESISSVTISADPNIIYLSGSSNQTIETTETTLKYQLFSPTPNNYTCAISSDPSVVDGSRATQGSEKVSLPEAIKVYRFTYTCKNTSTTEVISASAYVSVEYGGLCSSKTINPHFGCRRVGIAPDFEFYCAKINSSGINDCSGCEDWDPITINLLSQPCINGKMNVSSMVFGGFKPYTQYTWYYRAASSIIPNPNPWIIAKNVVCINPNDCGSYEYDFSKLTQTGNGSYQYYLRVEDCLREPGASGIFTTTCTNSSHYKCNASGNCVQDDANGIYTTSNCDNSCSGSLPLPLPPTDCLINAFDITPTFRTILLGGSFKASWNTADCTNCTLSCTTWAPGCGIAASGLPVSLSGNNYSIKPTQAGKYSYTLTCISPLTSETRGAGVIPGDKPFSVINFFWRETPAFLKLLVDELFQR